MFVRKKYLLIKFVLPLIILVSVIATGVVDVNIINTKRLSPIGNTNENYKKVSSELGEDFAGFIKDNSGLKIYTDNDEYIVVKFGENSFNIKSTKSIKKDINEKTTYIKNKFKEIKQKIEEIL